MASAQHPVRGPGRDQKGDSLVAIKEWLIRSPGSPHSEHRSTPLPDAKDPPAARKEFGESPSIAGAPEASVGPLPDAIDPPAARKEFGESLSIVGAPEASVGPLPDAVDPPAVRKEFGESPSIAGTPEVSVDSLLGGRDDGAAIADAAVTREFFETSAVHGNETLQDNEAQQHTKVRTGGHVSNERSAVRRLLFRALACIVLLAAAAGIAFAMLSPEEQRDISSAWQRLKDWSSYEFNAALPKKDSITVSQGTEAATQGVAPSETSGDVRSVNPDQTAMVNDKPVSAALRLQLEEITDTLSLAQRTVLDAWNRLKDWSADQWEAAFPKSDVATRSAADVRSVTPSATSDNGAPPAPQPVPKTDVSAPAELQNQINKISEDLTTLQQAITQLVAKQEKITTDIAMLQSAQQSVVQKLSALPRSLRRRVAQKREFSSPLGGVVARPPSQ